MSYRKPIPDHDDNLWAKGFVRYFLNEEVLESESFDDLKRRLSDRNHLNYYQIFFFEFQFDAIIISLEQLFAELLYKAYEHGHLKIKAGEIQFFTKKIERYLGVTNEEANKILKKEIGSEVKRLFTPHLMYFVSGLSLGNVLELIRNHLQNQGGITSLSDKLKEFIDIRTDVVHHRLTSRVDVNDRLVKGIEIGKDLIKLLKNKI